jgi:hypothetical protein
MPTPTPTNLLKTAGGLERRNEHVGPPVLREMWSDRGEQPGRDPTTVSAPIQGEILPGIPVPLATRGGKVGRVRENQVEASETRREIGTYRVDRQSLIPRASRHQLECGGIQVGGYDTPGPASC